MKKMGRNSRPIEVPLKAVRRAVRISVLANGNIRHIDDAQNCLKETSADGVLSAESLLGNPALFAGF
ncbi:hypothetical protein ACSBR2_024984 [Camellia fascicularis]